MARRRDWETLEEIRARSLRERRVPVWLGVDGGRWCWWVDLFREFWSQVAICALLQEKADPRVGEDTK